MGKGYIKGALILLLTLAVLMPEKSSGGTYRIQRRADWESWTYPAESVVLEEDGSIGLKWYRKNINAAADAASFEHESKDAKGLVSGGVRKAGSNLATAPRIIDGDMATWWRPAASAPLDEWWLELDLGRAVLASKIRIVFADSAGARPFRNFSVYTSEGARTSIRADIFSFARVGGTIEPNAEKVIEYDLRTIDPGAATGEHLVNKDTLDFAVVQYVRFIIEEKQLDAALVEIEVWSLGDNIALGTVQRGGTIRTGGSTESIFGLADGDINNDWRMTAGRIEAGDWVMSGAWYEWDLGATFWLDRLVSIEYPQYFGTSGMGHTYQNAFVMFTSDGTQLSGLSEDRVESNFDYQQLSYVDNLKTPRRLKFDLQFPLRPVRYIFYHVIPYFDGETPRNFFIKLFEKLIYGQGYPAAVEMTSDYLDLGNSKSITSVEWDIDSPPGTRMELRSRTGDTFEIETKYYNKAGTEIPVALWNKLPKSLKQEPVIIRRPGADWSAWSRIYIRSGEAFQSPSPRKSVQLQVRLLSDDFQVASKLRSIAINFDDPLLRGGIAARILPQEAPLDSLQLFSYSLSPLTNQGGAGFDQVIIRVPGPAEDVELRIGEQEVEPTGVEIVGDSLKVGLPRLVRRDSVTIRFRMSLAQMVTKFESWVGNTRSEVRQGVRASELQSTTVYVPAVVSQRTLLRHLEIVPGVITPNGDGVNDRAAIRFVVVKVESEPEVEIFALGGERVRVVEPVDGAYGWDGLDQSLQPVPPGIYICRIRVSAGVGDELVHRIINVAY